jgi:hypothetical protein
MRETQHAGFKMQTRIRTAVRTALLAFCILQLALIVGACAKAKAAGAPDGPPLAVPAPPPRVLLPV